jgi:hypothetical protein
MTQNDQVAAGPDEPASAVPDGRVAAGPDAPAGAVTDGQVTVVTDGSQGVPGEGVGWLPFVEDEAGTGGAPRRRRLLAVLAGAVVLLVAAMMLIFGPAALRVINARGTHLNTPPQVAGLTRDDSEQARQTVEYLKTAAAAGAPVDGPVGAVYSGPGERVVLFGGTAPGWSADKGLHAMFDLVAGEKDGVADAAGYDPGPLGGTLRCGSTTVDGTQRMAVCGWADQGSLVVVMVGARTPAEAAALVRQMRPAIEHRS